MDKLIKQETALNDEKQRLSAIVQNQPSKDQINNRFRGWERVLKYRYELNAKYLLKMSFNERWALLQALFSGKDQNASDMVFTLKNINLLGIHFILRSGATYRPSGMPAVLDMTRSVPPKPTINDKALKIHINIFINKFYIVHGKDFLKYVQRDMDGPAIKIIHAGVVDPRHFKNRGGDRAFSSLAEYGDVLQWLPEGFWPIIVPLGRR